MTWQNYLEISFFVRDSRNILILSFCPKFLKRLTKKTKLKKNNEDEKVLFFFYRFNFFHASTLKKFNSNLKLCYEVDLLNTKYQKTS